MKRFAAVLVLALVGLIALAQKKPAAPDPFREKAEDVLDCLDAANLVAMRADPVFYPQSLQCRPMLRRLERAAGSDQERALAQALHEYQSSIMACHLAAGGESCAWKVPRDKAIQTGQLRAPAVPGS
jgi:hypothetical protein